MVCSDLSQQSIKIIDDSESNLDLLVDALSDDYIISVALDGESGFQDIKEDLPDLVLLDIMMPGIDGYEVCRLLQADPLTKDIPIIFLSAMDEVSSKTRGFQLGAVDYITKPFEMLEVKARVKTHLALRCARRALSRQNELLEEKVQERTGELILTQEVTILSMASLAEARDQETGEHIMRTQCYVKLLAEELAKHPRFASQLTPENIELIYKSAPLHDIGKIGVADSILQKPDKLTPTEFEEMKQHTVYGYNAIVAAEKKLGSNSFLRFAREITYTHHENWNGSGYPRGIRGDAIPISGRLMALADTYDALISHRVYKKALSHALVVELIIREESIRFDPDVVKAFLVLQDTFNSIEQQLNSYKESHGEQS
jgi:cyclic di-GMP phosphodiesterase